jgi:hypothetical protein
MKKIIAVVCLLVIAAACAKEPPANKEAMSNANKPTETKSAALSEADMIANEKSAWETLQKKDYDGFEKLLASEYTEVRDDGVFDKAGILVSVKDLSITDVSYADWKTQPIDKDAYAITYTVTVKGSAKGQAFPPDPYHAASAWVNRDGKWVAIYYQETPVKPEPMPPPPVSSASPKAAVSPAAKAAEAGPDPIANEKLVWDAFRSRNYDAFAALLAPEFMEIETTGVYDKAGSVKGVSMMDASQYELSDWKAVKFDNDAALVTYVVTSTGPTKDKDRHSSIWINRDGKWLGLLHVGTPAATPKTK